MGVVRKYIFKSNIKKPFLMKRLTELSFYNPSDMHVYYKLDGNYIDEINGYNGTANGAMSFDNISENLQMAVFNTSYVNLPDLAGYNDTQTVMCFVKVRTLSIDNHIYNKGSDYTGAGGWGLVLRFSATRSTSKCVTVSPTSSTLLYGDYDSKIEEIIHFAYVYDNDNDTHKIYMNGTLVSSYTKNGNGLRGNKYVYLGANHISTNQFPTAALAGSMCEFSITKKALTAAEILEAATSK